jgi:hypothetical protein
MEGLTRNANHFKYLEPLINQKKCAKAHFFNNISNKLRISIHRFVSN